MAESALHSPRPAALPVRRNRLAWALRGFIIFILAVTAVGKLLDIPGFARVLATYEIFPDWSRLPLALFVPLFELALAGWLGSGKKLPAAALVALLLHLAYAVLSTLTILRGIHLANCGCFGVFLARPLGWGTVLEDGVLVLVCLVVYLSALRSRS